MVEPLKSLLILIGNSGQVFGIAYLRDELTSSYDPATPGFS